MPPSTERRFELREKRMLLFCAFVGLVLNSFIAFTNSSTWSVDFNQYYSAGKLVGTGRLYDWPSIRRLELQRNTKAVPFGRFPALAVGFKPLSALPYPVARALWLGIGIAAMAGFVYFWPLSQRPWAVVAVVTSVPTSMCLAFGQDSVLFLFFTALGLKLLIDEHDFAAGLAFSACIAKPHIALLLPVLLVARKKWSALLGGFIGGVAAMAVSFAAEGWDWPHRLLVLMRVPDFDPAAARMPNLRGLLSYASGSLGVEVALAVVVLAVFWYISRSQRLPIAGALALAGGLLLSHHAYTYDALLLLPILLLPWQLAGVEWLRLWALFLLTPVPYLFLLTDPLGIVAHLAITGYTLTLLVLSVRCTWNTPLLGLPQHLGPECAAEQGK